MDKKLARTATVAFLTFLMFVSLIYATIVWQRTTTITITEPFLIESDISESINNTGTYTYTINVTNNGGKQYDATLYYQITEKNLTVSISPSNGTTSTSIPSGEKRTFDVSVDVNLNEGYSTGTATIDWWVERS